MEPEEMLRAGRFPVLSGPDRLSLVLGLVEPIAMGTMREVSFRILSAPGGPVAQARGRIMELHAANRGDDAYDVVVEHVDGDFCLIRDYRPEHGHCRGVSWFDSRLAPGSGEGKYRRVCYSRFKRHELMDAVVHMGFVPWRTDEGVLQVPVETTIGTVAVLQDPSWRGAVYRAQGSISSRLIGAVRDEQGNLLIQFTDRQGKVFNGLIDPDGALQWIQFGRRWRDRLSKAD